MRRVAALAVTLVLSLAGVLHAQSTKASLTGQVVDQSKAIMPDAKVTLINKATNLLYKGTTNQAGIYYVTEIPAGTYRIEVEKIGFKSVIKPEIILHVQDALQINFEMELGSVSESITVSAEASSVQLTTSAISSITDSITVRELPLNGRSWTDLAALQPGVAVIETQVLFTAGANRGNRGFGNQISISGARPQQNNYRLDGISLNDYANGAPGSVLGGNLGVDAIQEFSVLTSNASAEYGKTAGGVVNAISRQGTNQFHGNVYEFLRNSALDARNFFDRGSIPPFKRNQFGGSAGGPIRKDRTFIFGDFEAIRQSKGIAFTDFVPSPAARAGLLSSGPVTVDPSAAKYLGFYPLPNGPLLSNGDVGIFGFGAQQVVSENYLTIRVDHKISEKDSLFGLYLYDATPFQTPDALDNQLLGSHTNRQIVVLEENHIFSPTLINTVRFGYNREAVANAASVSAINSLAKDPSLGAVPGRNAAQLTISKLTTFVGGIDASSSYFYHWNSFQVYDDAFLTRGNHSLKFGVAVERMDLNMLSQSFPSGAFTFTSLSNFLTNKPKRFTSGFINTLTPRGLRQTLVGAYAQDDWHARPGLTLNLGLRYEMTTVPTEVQGKLSNLLNITDSAAHLGDPFFSNPTLGNFEPRVGFAWDPFGNGKTAVRGGFGLFDVLPLPYQTLLLTLNSQPFSRVGATSTLPTGSFYTGALPLIGASGERQTYLEQKPKRDYVMQWNLNVQRELTSGLTALIGYVGSRGVHQPFRVDDANIVMPKLTSAGYLIPSPESSGIPINPAFGDIRAMFYEGNSHYHALEVGIRKKMSRGLQVQGSFTWGKTIDSSSASLAGDQFSNSISSLPWYDLRSLRGPSDFNVSRTLVISLTWQLPSPKFFSATAKRPNCNCASWRLGCSLSIRVSSECASE